MKKLFRFQETALNYLDSKNKALLALDMGLGKTLTAIHWLKRKQHLNNFCLFVLCQKNKISDWKEEIESEGTNRQVIEITSQLHLAKVLKDYESKPQELNNIAIIMSYQLFTLFSRKNPKWWKKLKVNQGLIFDESQGLRNRTSYLSKICFQWTTNLTYVLLLSGDPIPNGYHDLYGQLRVLEVFPEKYKWDDFLKDYCITRPLPGTSVLMVIGYKNLENLEELIKPISYFLRTEDAVDLPDLWFIDNKGDTSHHYRDFKKHKLITIDSWTCLSQGPLSEMLILRQLSSGFINNREDPENPIIIPTSNHKIELLEQLLEDMIMQPIVIFYNFVYEKEVLVKHLMKTRKIIEINGQVNNFHKGTNYPNNTVFLVQYQAGAKGIDGLQNYCSRTIYYSPTLSGELFKQSIKRTHRVGQTKKCIYHRLINSKLEELIYQTLSKYQDFTLDLFLKLKLDD